MNRFTAFDSSHKQVTNEQRNKMMSFRHPVYQNGKIFDQDGTKIAKLIIDTVTNTLGYTYSNIENVICQLQLPTPPSKNPIAHVDMPGVPFDYYSCVYYINDADGPTVLKIDDGEVLVHPKQGRAVVFSGNIYHIAGKPTEDIRSILNMCFY